MWVQKDGNQSEQKAIKGGQVRGSLSGAIADDKLLLEQQGFRGDGADAAGAKEFRNGYEQVNRQEEHVAHELHVTTHANLRKTAPQGLFGLHFTNSPGTRSLDENGKTKPPLALVKLLKVLDRHPDLLEEFKAA